MDQETTHDRHMNQGKITIGRSQGGSDETQKYPIHIEVTDGASGTQFLEVRMSLEEFGSAITGHGYVDCIFKLRPQHVGKIREVKTMEVPVSKEDRYIDRRKEPEAAKRILSSFEVDGWMGRTGDLFNGHRQTANGYNVVFIRFVDPPQPSCSPSDPPDGSTPVPDDKTPASTQGDAGKGHL